MEESGFTREEKLDSDMRRLRSAAKGVEWTDEFGQMYHPDRREDVLAGMKRIELMKTNLEKLGQVFAALSKEK